MTQFTLQFKATHIAMLYSKQLAFQLTLHFAVQYVAHYLLFYFIISRNCCIALQFYSRHHIAFSQQLQHFYQGQNVLHFIRHQVKHKMQWINTGVENIIKQLFGCNCVGQCVKYYCVFMQLPMPYHSIEHTNAPY